MRKHSIGRICAVAVSLLVMAAALQAQAPATSPGGPSEGIKVHGRWTIAVLNADGTVASRHEFDNALTNGRTVLAQLLSRFRSHVGDWTIKLEGTSGGSGQVFWIEEHFGSWPPPIGKLAVTLILQSRVELNGSIQAAGPVSIHEVSTVVETCRDTGCPEAWEFTRHVLSAPINVAANQIVQVKVVISFS